MKNPLNAMIMHVELAKMKLARGDTTVAPQLEIIGSEILRLDRVVKTFLDFNRPMELKMADVDPDGLVSQLAELARPQATASNVMLDLKTGAAGSTINADVDLLKQAFLNLVVNGIEAMPEGGTMTVETFKHPDEVEIRVSDTGCGIPEELREKIFRLYFTTKQTGSGIGLAMTFRMIQLHGGTIGFTSQPNQGTTFVVRLPLSGSSE